jgi:hypothetical protein
MAKRRSNRTVSLAPYRASAPQPIVIRTSSGLAKAPKRRRGGGHRKSGGGLLGGGVGGIIVGAGAMGMLAKSNVWSSIPALPMVGKVGTVAIAAWAWSRYGGGGQLARNVMLASAAIAAYQYGKDGKIDGDDMM